MDTDTFHERIVVGVDRSDAAREALRWALGQARLTGATVHAVHAWHRRAGTGVVAELPGRMAETGATPSIVPPLRGSVERQRETDDAGLAEADLEAAALHARHEHEAERLLEEAVRDAATGPVPQIVREVIEGQAADVLVHAARGADLLVLGCRGRGRVGDAILGSVGRHCVHDAPCPVVIVPRGAPARAPGERSAAAAMR